MPADVTPVSVTHVSATPAPAAPAAAPAAPAPATPAAAPAVAAPAAPAVEAPATLPVPQAPAVTPAPAAPQAATGAVKYAPTGDAGLDLVMGFLGGLGMGSDNPGIVAAGKGDFNVIKALLASNPKAQGWEQYIKIAEDAYGRTAAQAAERGKAIDTAVHAIAGSPENWAAARDWAAKNADPVEVEKINGMMGDPFTAKIAAHYLVGLHQKFGGPVTKQPAPTTAVAAPASPSTPNTPLTKGEFALLARDLHKRHGDGYQQTPEYQAAARRLIR